MRKLIAAIAMSIVLIGTLAPVAFSLTENTSSQIGSFSKISLKTQIQKAFAIAPNSDGTCPASYPIKNSAGDCVADSNGSASPTTKQLDCDSFDFACKITTFVVDLITFVPNFIAVLLGALSDVFLKISISPGTYGSTVGQGIESGIRDAWKIVRDFANIGFIFALFVAAFMLILDKTSVGGTQFEPKKVVVRVIIMALLVNFSLLFCRLTIQTADIFSNLLYSKLGKYDYGDVNNGNTTAKTVGSIFNDIGMKSVSLPLISLSDPQSLFLNGGITPGAEGRNAAYLIVGFCIFFVLLLLIWTFASMMFIFLGRILGLWLGIILSPLAFVSFAIPFLEKNEFIGFDSWLKNFFQLAFMTPVYLFFMYITISILNMKGIGAAVTSVSGITATGGQTWLVSVLGLVVKTMIPLLLSCFLLLQGKKIATKMSGQIGEMVGSMSGAVTGLAMGAATGGTALLARQTVGRAGSAIAESGAVKNQMAKGGIMGGLATGINYAGNKTSAATFDVRNSATFSKGVDRLGGIAGEKINTGGDKFKNTGGFEAEGGVRDNLRKGRVGIEEWKMKKDKYVADQLAPGKQSGLQRELRDREDKLAQAKQAAAAEKTKIDMEAENQNVSKILQQLNNDKAGMTSRNPELEKDIKDRTILKETKETLETKEKELKEKIETLEVKEKDTTITATERIELTAARADAATNKTALTKTKDDIKKIDNKEDVKAFDKIDKQAKTLDKALAKEPNPAKRANMTIREVKQQGANAKIVAEGSLEKELMDEAKEKFTKEKESFDTLDKDMKKLESAIRKMSKDKTGAYSAEEIADAEKQLITTREKREEQYKKQKKAKDDHKEAEDAYKDAYGDDVKNLDSASKDAEDTYKKSDDIKKRLKDLAVNVDNAEMQLNDQKNEVENVTYGRKQVMVERLENEAKKPLFETGNIIKKGGLIDDATQFIPETWKEKANRISRRVATIPNAVSSGAARSADATRKTMKS